MFRQGVFWCFSYLEGSGVAVKKWTQGRPGSLGRIDTMLPVVQKPPESMQMPLALSLRIDIMTSAVTDPETTTRTEKGALIEPVLPGPRSSRVGRTTQLDCDPLGHQASVVSQRLLGTQNWASLTVVMPE